MARSVFRKLVTYLTEGIGLMTEFWIIGVIHELGKATVYYDGNVNKPEVGYLLAIIFSLFYLARFVGSLTGLLFANSHRFIFISAYFYGGLILATFGMGIFTNVYFLIAFRVILGYCSGFTPVMCILRTESDKVNLLSEMHRGEYKTKKIMEIKSLGLVIIEFLFSYGSMLLAVILQFGAFGGIFLQSTVFTLIITASAALFFINFAYFESTVRIFYF